MIQNLKIQKEIIDGRDTLTKSGLSPVLAAGILRTLLMVAGRMLGVLHHLLVRKDARWVLQWKSRACRLLLL